MKWCSAVKESSRKTDAIKGRRESEGQLVKIPLPQLSLHSKDQDMNLQGSEPWKVTYCIDALIPEGCL